MLRKTKIVCTLGPASDSEEMISKLMDAGMNVCRLNMSHGSYEEQGARIDRIKRLRKEKNIPVAEKRLSIDELVQAYKNGTLTEMFAAGTAAIVSPVGELLYKDELMIINDRKIGPVAQEMYDTIYGIQTGRIDDFMNWTVPVE